MTIQRNPLRDKQLQAADRLYISGWLHRLRDDRKLVVMAAAQGQKAADYILAQDEKGGDN